MEESGQDLVLQLFRRHAFGGLGVDRVVLLPLQQIQQAILLGRP